MPERNGRIERAGNLNKYPQKVKHHATHVSLGDLHGNALKLIYCLVEEGILSLNEDQYNQLRNIYNTPIALLTKEQVLLFEELINSAETNKDVALTLIGDELADRGNNDYFTLLVLKRLRDTGVPFDILLSNHSAAFIRDYDKSTFTGKAGFMADQGQSLRNMHQLITRGAIKENNVRVLVSECYVPFVKAINYTVSEKGELTLFTHAPVGLETVKALAIYFKMSYKDHSIKALTATIDAINEQINELFRQKKLGEIIDTAFTEGPIEKQRVNQICRFALGGNPRAIPTQAPLKRLVWNRHIDSIEQIETIPSGAFKVRFVHGHIGPQPFSLHSKPLASHMNLDSYFGKAPSLFHTQAGVKHVVRHSNELTSYELQQDPQHLKKFYLKKLDSLIDTLQEKINELKDKGNIKSLNYNPKYKEAAQAADKLFNHIDTARKELAKNMTKETLEQFIDDCNAASKTAQSVLGKQRGIKRVLETIATFLNRCLVLLKTGSLAAYKEAPEIELDTDSMNKAKNFKEELEKFKQGYEDEFEPPHLSNTK